MFKGRYALQPELSSDDWSNESSNNSDSCMSFSKMDVDATASADDEERESDAESTEGTHIDGTTDFPMYFRCIEWVDNQ